MDVLSLPRKPLEFQQPLSRDELLAVIQQAFPAGPPVNAVREVSGGRYNTTYRLDRKDAPSLILRVAPEPRRQSRLGHQLLRNEYASIPLLASVGHLMPVVVRADFTQTIIERDYLIQTHLPGVPAAQALKLYTAEQQLDFWFQLGQILADIHSQTGHHYGSVTGDQHESWSNSLTATFHAIAADMADTGLDAADIHQVLHLIEEHSPEIDQCGLPRLLHGDLWIGNVMLKAGEPSPRIVGIFDCDRTSWGDPESDWTLFLLRSRSDEVQQAFRRGYGRAPEASSRATVRGRFYRARSIAEARLEYRRMGEEELMAGTHIEMKDVLSQFD
ncbi:phosphotransferase family protein [Arthrobacter sp. HLT1-21]